MASALAAPAALAAPSPVAAYSFREGAGTTLHDSVGNHDGTISGATWTSSGKYGSALDFDGTDDLVTIADAADLELTDSFTLEAWVRPDALSEWSTALAKAESPGGKYAGYWLAANAYTGPSGNIANATGEVRGVYDVGNTLATGAWTHVAVTYDGTILRIYINGVHKDSSTPPIGLVATSAPLKIGSNPLVNTYFNGLIDEVRLYDVALSTSQIEADRDTPIAPIAAYSFDEGSGGTLHDLAGNHDGTISGATWTASGKNGAALDFDGVNDLVSVADANDLDLTNSFTLEAWVRPDALTAGPTITKGESTGGISGYALSARYLGYPTGHATSAGTIKAVTAPTALSAETWSHIAFTSDGTNLHYYVNGQLVATAAGVAAKATAANLELGHSQVLANWFDGRIDDVRIYDATLPESRIQADRDAPVDPTPIAAYHFNDGSGATLHDSAGNHDGTLEGGVSWTSSGKYGGALDFDGIDDVVSVADANDLDLTDSFTLEAWVRPDTLKGASIIAKGDSVEGKIYGYWLHAGYTGEKPSGTAGSAAGTLKSAFGPSLLPTGQWSHLAFTSDGTNLRLYVNGQLAATEAAVVVPATIAKLKIGKSITGAYDGRIDEVRIYDVPLSAAQIAEESPAAPEATTQSASNVEAKNATLSASVNPKGAATTYQFEYGTTTSYGSKYPTSPRTAGSGASPLSVSETPKGLAEGTTYHYRVAATNEAGTTYGADKTFTTLYLPDVVTEPAEEVGANEAVLMADVDPNGEETEYKFEYGTTTSYGQIASSPEESVSEEDESIEAEEGIAFLQPETTYHYRVVATSDGGTVVGADKTITTGARTATPQQEQEQAQAEASGVSVPPAFVNVMWSGDETPGTKTGMELIRGSGAKMLRMGVGRNWNLYDKVFGIGGRKDITILPTLGSGGHIEQENGEGIRPEFRKEVREIVEHYGVGGSFWQTVQNQADRRPPEYWEIWNEQNYGVREPSYPAKYGDMLEEAAQVIHSVNNNAGAKIVVGGLLTTGKNTQGEGVPHYEVGEFIRQMGHSEAYDALGLHPYAFKAGSGDSAHKPANADDVKDIKEKVRKNIQEARAALNDKGGKNKKIWITEIGWPVEGPTTPNDGSHVPVSEDIQRDLLNSTFNMIKATSDSGHFNIANVFYYNIQDNEDGSHSWEKWDYRSGLREEYKPFEEGHYRKSWFAFQNQAGFTGTFPKKNKDQHKGRDVRPRKLIQTTTINPYGSGTEFWVKWGPGSGGASYGNFTTAQSFGDEVEEGDVDKQTTVTGLQPKSDYHYRVVAENDAGEKVETEDLSFTTPPSTSTSTNVKRVLHGQPGWVWIDGWVKEGYIDGSLPGLANVHVHVKLFRNGQFQRFVDVMTNGEGHYDSGYLEVGKGDWEVATEFPGGGEWNASETDPRKTFTVRDGVRIVAKHSGKCMDIEGLSTDDFARVMHGECNGGANQVFTLRPKGDGSSFELVPRHSGKCVDVEFQSTNDGAHVIQHSCNGGNNQAFSEDFIVGTDYRKFKAVHSQKCLDVTGGNTGWVQFQQWTCNSNAQQQFILQPVESDPIPTQTSIEIDQLLHGSPGLVKLHGHLQAGTYSMANRVVHVIFDNADNCCLDADGGNLGLTVDGNNYYQATDFALDPGHWIIHAEFAGNSEFGWSRSGDHPETVKRGYRFKNRYSDKCLTLSENNNSNGAAIIQYDCVNPVNGNGQVFSYWPKGNGWYEIKINGTNKCVDVKDVSTANGAWLQAWQCIGDNQYNQHWRREPVQNNWPYLALMPRHTYPGKCMDDLGFSTGNTRIGQWDCTWAGNQQWDEQGVIDP